MLSSNTDKKIKFKFERGIFNSKFYSTYTFFQNLRKIRIYLSDSSLSYLEIFIKKFESHLNIQIYLHICDILNPITSHPQLGSSTPLVSFTKSLLIIYTRATKCFVRFVGFLTLSRLNLSLDPLLRLIGVEYGCT